MTLSATITLLFSVHLSLNYWQDPLVESRKACKQGNLEKCEEALKSANDAGKSRIIREIEGEIDKLKKSPPTPNPDPPDRGPEVNKNAQAEQEVKALEAETAWETSLEDYRKGVRCATESQAFCDPNPTTVHSFVDERQKHGINGYVSEGVAEALTLVADIAIKRAKQQGLAVLQTRLREAICQLTLEPDTKSAPSKANPALPNTCSLLENTTIDKLVGDPRPLQIALFGDLVSVVAAHFISGALATVQPSLEGPPRDFERDVKSARNLEKLVNVAMTTTLRVVTRKTPTFLSHDAQGLYRLLLASAGTDPRQQIFWQKARGVPLGLAAAALLLNRGDEKLSLAEIIALLSTDRCRFAVEKKKVGVAIPAADAEPPAAGPAEPCVPLELTSADFTTAFEIANLAIIAGTARKNDNPDNPERVKAAVALTFRALVEYFTQNGRPTRQLANVRDLRALFEAALEQDVPTAVSASARLLISQLGALTPEKAPANDKDSRTATRKRRAIEKAVALLTGVAAYADTYTDLEEGSAAPTTEQVRQARRDVLENLIDATTVRAKRHGEWVASLGIPVGFTTGLQWARVRDADGDFKFPSMPQAMAPQLTLPLGIALQLLPGRAYANGRTYPARRASGNRELPRSRAFADGFHLFASILDLGQFLNYDAEGKVNRPRWDSFISPGLQLGWIVGTPANSFILALDARYAPTLFAGTSTLTVPADTSPGGALRLGLTLAYYIPLFDFN